MVVKDPVISIIIPVFNCAEFIEETIQSIKNQTFKEFECIIIDDGSLDETQELIKNNITDDLRFRFHLRPAHTQKGASSCRNYGFKLAKGEYIQWFDGDDLMHPEMLRYKFNSFSNNLDFVVCQTVNFSEYKENNTSKPTNIKSEQPFMDFFKGNIIFYTPGPLWKKSFLDELDILFREDLLNIQEWEFYCRVLLSKPKFAIVEKPLIYYRKHPNSIWGKRRTKEKILSEFIGVKDTYSAAVIYQSKIYQTYFLRLGKLFREMKIENDKDSEIIKREVKRVLLLRPWKLKNLLRYYYWRV